MILQMDSIWINEDCIIDHHNTAVPGPLKVGAVSLNSSITPSPSNVCTKRTSLKLHGKVQVPYTMVKHRCFILHSTLHKMLEAANAECLFT